MDAQSQSIVDAVLGLGLRLIPALRKGMKAGMAILQAAAVSAAPRAKKERRVHGIRITPGLTAGSIGTSVKYQKESGTVRSKVGLNVARQRAPSATDGVPGKHKSYWAPWQTTGTAERTTGYKTRRSRKSGVMVITKVKTGNTIRPTGRITPDDWFAIAIRGATGAAQAATVAVLEKELRK